MAATPSLKPPRIQTLARASAIIDVIAAGDEAGVGLSEISKATALNKTTAFNLLASLVTLRFVEQDAQSRRYRVGLRCLELGRHVQQRLEVSHLARPILVDLCSKTNETVNLGLPGMRDFRVVDSFQGTRILHGRASAGWRWMYHCTALGKAFLAGWDAPMRQAIYNSCELTRLTPNTITEVDTLETQLAQFREQGFATDIEEYEIGVNGVASWVIDGQAQDERSSRLTEDVLHRIAPDVIRAANDISAGLGGGEPHQVAVGQ